MNLRDKVAFAVIVMALLVSVSFLFARCDAHEAKLNTLQRQVVILQGKVAELQKLAGVPRHDPIPVKPGED